LLSDSRKNRAKSAALNLAVYAKEAIKKSVLSKPSLINRYLDTIEGPDGVILSTEGEDPQTKLKKSAPQLICLNIPSYARGADLWKWSQDVAVNLPEKQAEKLKSAVQDFGDSKLEVIVYDDIYKFQRDVLKGQHINPTNMFGYAKRVCSREAPIDFNFKAPGRYHIRKNRVYMQIDGEAFVVIYPENVKISLLKKVKVLINVGEPLEKVPELKKSQTQLRAMTSTSLTSKNTQTAAPSPS